MTRKAVLVYCTFSKRPVYLEDRLEERDGMALLSFLCYYSLNNVLKKYCQAVKWLW